MHIPFKPILKQFCTLPKFGKELQDKIFYQYFSDIIRCISILPGSSSSLQREINSVPFCLSGQFFPSILGPTLNGKNLLLREQILCLQS